jgi:hypothetical protein
MKPSSVSQRRLMTSSRRASASVPPPNAEEAMRANVTAISAYETSTSSIIRHAPSRIRDSPAAQEHGVRPPHGRTPCTHSVSGSAIGTTLQTLRAARRVRNICRTTYVEKKFGARPPQGRTPIVFDPVSRSGWDGFAYRGERDLVRIQAGTDTCQVFRRFSCAEPPRSNPSGRESIPVLKNIGIRFARAAASSRWVLIPTIDVPVDGHAAGCRHLENRAKPARCPSMPSAPRGRPATARKYRRA